MLKSQHRESEAHRIQAEFQSFNGGASTEEFSTHLLGNGFWDEDELAKVTVRWAQKKIRDALKEIDSAGLPYAIPSSARTESGAPIWKQLDFCSFSDVEGQVQLLNKQESALREQKQHLVRYAIRRWNRVPSATDREQEEGAA